MKLSQLIDIVTGNIFRKYLAILHDLEDWAQILNAFQFLNLS